MPIDGLKHAGLVRTDGANVHDVLFGQRRVVEQDAHDGWMRVAHHPLNEPSVVRARERLPLPEREGATSAEVRDALPRFHSFVFFERDQEVS
jgi:hypothetical protein